MWQNYQSLPRTIVQEDCFVLRSCHFMYCSILLGYRNWHQPRSTLLKWGYLHQICEQQKWPICHELFIDGNNPKSYRWHREQQKSYFYLWVLWKRWILGIYYPFLCIYIHRTISNHLFLYGNCFTRDLPPENNWIWH